MVRTIVWDKEALIQLETIYEYLKEHLAQAADKVLKSIRKTVTDLSYRPEIYGLDRFKINNEGDFRAFEKYSYRVPYREQDNKITILRVRHTSRKPLEH